MEIEFPINLLLASMNARYYNYCYMVLAQKIFYLFGLCLIEVLYNSQSIVKIIEILKEF